MDDSSDFPQRHATHTINAHAEHRFQAAVLEAGVFVTQKGLGPDDYGTDFQIEVKEGDCMTNYRVHVQLKGTNAKKNKNGSVSVSVKRSTLNYLLSQPDSIFVCCHFPEATLLVTYASEVLRQHENHSDNWRDQKEITVRFASQFDSTFQQDLASRVLARGREGRADRDGWTMTSPQGYPGALREVVATIEVPHDKTVANAILQSLFNSCADEVISKAFDKFGAVLDETAGEMDLAYMAEINLSVSSQRPTSTTRLRKAVDILIASLKRGESHPGGIHYCIGNAWSACGEPAKALDSYTIALGLLEGISLNGTKSFCLKNKGGAHEKLGEIHAAREAFEEALRLNPELPEAHLALGQWHRFHSHDYEAAITHFDKAIPDNAPVSIALAPQAWKAESLFLAERGDEAFKEVRSLQRMVNQAPWVQAWCFRLVATHGRNSLEEAASAQKFWKWFLKRSPDDLEAKRELFMCCSYLDAEKRDAGIDYASFKKMAEELVGVGDAESALLWDRVGHWAMRRQDWQEAESGFRKASDLDTLTFGSCLGVALNGLKRYGEALPILLFQAEENLQDALSWFHVAISREGVGDTEGCIAAYRKALELDPNYPLAWFNLGGIYWNVQLFHEAETIWNEAVMKFPHHPLVKQLNLNFVPTQIQADQPPTPQ